MNKLKFNVFIPFYALSKPNDADSQSKYIKLREIVLECERLGYCSAFLDDHLMYGKTPIFECWTTLSALASATTKIRLGTMVTSAAFRNPALLAKMAATVDVISNGRLEFGIGSGVQENEHVAYGFSFPAPSARIGRLQETVEIVKALWTQDKTSYNGRFYQVADAVCEPKPLQKPHPPITVGGSGEKLTLKVTAQHADRFDFGYLPTLEQYTHKLATLERHCRAAGRDFNEIEKSCWPAGQIILGEDQQTLEDKVQSLQPKGVSREEFEKSSFIGTAEDFKTAIKPYVDLGVTSFTVFFGDLPEMDTLRRFTEVSAGV